jgi:ATP-dependent Clp endopeptidase proteolytic subunit ClpP
MSKPAWFTIRNEAPDAAEILIYSQVGKDWYSDDGVSAKEFDAALKDIPAHKAILVRINSPGGNVWDGLAIYNMLKARGEKVTCRVDGLAASIASVIACAGAKCEMPANALMMIHDPSTVVAGTAEDMRKTADVLEQHAGIIANVYAEKCGKSAEKMRELMRAETWMTGDEAHDMGLCSDVTDEVALAASVQKFDLSAFKRVPEALTKVANQTPSAAARSKENTRKSMDRSQIIALLTEHGIQVAADATDEVLQAELKKILAAKRTATPAPAAPDVNALNASVAAITAQLQAERKTRIKNRVTELQPNRFPVAQVDEWVDRAMADESILNSLAAMPAKPPGASPISVDVTGDDPKDISKAVMNLWGGRDILGPVQARERGIARAQILKKGMDRLSPILNADSTHTIGADLKRIALLQAMVRAFATRISSLKAFSTSLNAVVLEGTDTVAVPYYALESAASTDFIAANGYDTFGNTSTDSRKVTLDKRKYQGVSWTSSELRRQPYLNIEMLALLKAQKLAVDVWTDVLSAVTVANFGASVIAVPAAAWTSDTAADAKLYADQAQWPEVGRSLIVNSTIENALLKDTAIKGSLNYGGSEAIRQGNVPQIFGFDFYSNPNVPSNSENLLGMLVFKSAILFAQAPIAPTEEVANLLTRYEVVVDPDAGCSCEYRLWGDADKDTSREVIECNYGYIKGEAAALKRITSA